jgi:hypothetical protein
VLVEPFGALEHAASHPSRTIAMPPVRNAPRQTLPGMPSMIAKSALLRDAGTDVEPGV